MKVYVVRRFDDGIREIMGVCSSLTNARHMIFSTIENDYGEEAIRFNKQLDVMECCYEEYQVNKTMYSISLFIVDGNID